MTAKPEITQSIRRSIFSGRYIADFTLRAQLPSEQLLGFIAGLGEVLRLVGSTKGEIVNVKGADSGEYHQVVITNPEDELAFVAGEIAVAREPDKDEEDEFGVDRNSPDVSIEPFDIRLTTRFKNFGSRSSIVHSVIERRLGPLPEHSSIELISKVEGIKIDEFRLGIDFFKPHYFSIFGVTPTVVETLVVKIKAEQLELKIHAEQLATRSSIPLTAPGVFEALNRALQQGIGVDLLRECQISR